MSDEKKFKDVDYAKIEARLLAHHLANGGTFDDLYNGKFPPETRVERDRIKARNFSESYGDSTSARRRK